MKPFSRSVAAATPVAACVVCGTGLAVVMVRVVRRAVSGSTPAASGHEDTWTLSFEAQTDHSEHAEHEAAGIPARAAADGDVAGSIDLAAPADTLRIVEDRGNGAPWGLDLGRLRETHGFEPVVQYLTFIQERRGDASHLLFVRDADLNRMAGLTHDGLQGFVERLDRLGVLVSNN